MLPTVESYPTRFEAEWRDYRRRSRLAWITILSYVPLCYFFQATGTVATLWFILYVVSLGAREFWRCPQCGNGFFHSISHRNSFATQCHHCGLRKWEGSSFDKDRSFLN